MDTWSLRLLDGNEVGYFTLEGNHVDIVSVGHVINMKNGQLLYIPQNDDTEYISMTQKDY